MPIADDIREHYRPLWAELGPDGGPHRRWIADVAYPIAFTSLTLAFTPASGTGTVYMVFGVFRTS